MAPLHLGIQSTAHQAVMQHLLLKKECISGPIQFKPVLFRGQLYLFQFQVLTYTKQQKVK